ncbi:hypothetical protein DIE17_31660 [Burkholderia sp. Bp9099]|nr:hypothetical protein DIE17_31660 [Burkholderia sp. Bp9099]
MNTRGEYDLIARSIFARLPAGSEPVFAQAFLTASGLDGTGRYIHGDINDVGHAFAFSSVFELPDYTPLPGPGAMRVPRGLGGINTISSVFDGLGYGKRRTPFLFKAGHISEVTKVELPVAMKVLSLPKPVTVASPFGTYTSSYAVEDRTITVTRTLDLTSKTPYLQPDQCPDLGKMATSIKHDLAAQIVYQ